MFFDRTEGNIIQNIQWKLPGIQGVSKLNVKNILENVIIIVNCYWHELPRELLKPTSTVKIFVFDVENFQIPISVFCLVFINI